MVAPAAIIEADLIELFEDPAREDLVGAAV